MEYEQVLELEADGGQLDGLDPTGQVGLAPTREQFEASQHAERAAVSRLREALLARGVPEIPARALRGSGRRRHRAHGIRLGRVERRSRPDLPLDWRHSFGSETTGVT